MDHIEELSFLLTKLCADIESVNKSIKRPAKERLMISASGKRMMYFSQKGSGKSRKLRYINSDPDHIYYLAYQAFQTELLRRLEYNEARLASVFKELKPLDHQSIIQDLPKHFDLLDPVRVVHPGYKKYGHTYPNPSWNIAPREAELTIGNMDPFEWAAMEYCENTDHLEYKIHPTSHGICCRSKSESILFELYDKLMIPFHYDEVLTIGGIRISPDLRGVRRDGALIYHEHRGLHSEEYIARNEWKSSLYSSAGILPGVNLLYTYDNPAGALNVKLAEELLRDIYWL